MSDVARQSVTMDDVARRAGVSRGTVSNALNHPDRVAATTLAAVRQAIGELGFARNDHARSLAGGRSTTIGLVLTDLENSYFVDIAQGAEDGAMQHGLTILIANSQRDEARQRTYLDLFEEARLAGTLLAPHTASQAIAGTVQSSRPLVALNVALDPALRCSVSVDNELGGYLAAQHLIETGCRHIAYIGGSDRLDPIRERRQGVRRAVADSGRQIRLTEITVPAVRTPDGRTAALDILQRPPDARPDGIAAASDLLALGLVQVLHDKVRIPEEIAIIGYDDNAAARESIVPITTIAQPGHEVGRAGADLLREELSGQPHTHRQIRLAPQLRIRQSTAG
ncbi:MAG: LacI family DNA-binding transcriptional regulator [Propionicimonas sp.]|nr:LacI family DNA-binding transcriptional regulator [Propionicimonas sp.]